MYIDHSALKYFINKLELVEKIYHWLILFQEFDFDIIVKLGRLNLGLDHLSRIESGEEPSNPDDNLHDAQLFVITMLDDHYRDIIQFFSMGYVPAKFTTAQKKQLVVRAVEFQLITRQLYMMGLDENIFRCILNHELLLILNEVHDGVVGCHYVGKSTVHKILQAGLWWPTMHANGRDYCRSCDVCQRMGKSS